MKNTLVFGASLRGDRYSNLAIRRLKSQGVETTAFGLVKGEVGDVEVRTSVDDFEDIHTITLYMNPRRQQDYYDSIIALKPERVIFNPGTENPEFYTLLREENISVEEACTLTLLAIGQY